MMLSVDLVARKLNPDKYKEINKPVSPVSTSQANARSYVHDHDSPATDRTDSRPPSMVGYVIASVIALVILYLVLR